MKQPEQEVPIKRMKLSRTALGANTFPPIPQVVSIAIEKTLTLDKIHEHEPVKHYGGIPFTITLVSYALYEI